MTGAAEDCRISTVADLGDEISYKRCLFFATLPKAYRYTAAHCWLAKVAEPDVWRVGFTKFAVRMLGDFVEMQAHLQPGDRVGLGQEIGSYEGLKAVSSLYCAVDGLFHRVNPALDSDGEISRIDPHAAGWLYEVRGTPDPSSHDVLGYVGVLNATIDKLQGEPKKENANG